MTTTLAYLPSRVGPLAFAVPPKGCLPDSALGASLEATAPPLDADRPSAFYRAGPGQSAKAVVMKDDVMIGAELRDVHYLLSRFSGENAPPKDVVQADLATLAELLAAVQALLRQPAESPEAVLTVGPLQLDLLSRTVRRGGRKIELRPKELRLLEYMMRRKGQVLTRAVLFMEVWNYKFVPESNLVDVHMGRLRRNIDQGDETPMIYSIRGQGFMLREPGGHGVVKLAVACQHGRRDERSANA
ncbi:MAG: response regulator transcription factor [Methylocystis sp.]